MDPVPATTAVAPLFSNPWILPGLIAVGGILLGWIADRVVRVQLEKWAKTTPWKGDEIILASLKGIVWLWVALLGFHLAGKSAPETQHLSDVTGRLGEILFVASLTLAAARITTSSLLLYAEKLNLKGSATLLLLLAKIVIFAIGGLVLLQTEGISIAPVLTAFGVGGLAVALALQDTLGNFFAGIHILVAGQIRPGDFIRIDADNEGWITDIGWRNTSIRTMANNIVVVPNKKLGETIITNLTMPQQHMALRVAVGVAYESDLEQVERVLLEIGQQVAAACTGVNADTPPSVRFAAFNDSSVEARLSLMARDIDSFYLVRHLLIKAIHARFREVGISIAYPTRTVYMAEGQSPAAAPSAAVPLAANNGPSAADAATDDHD